MKVVIAIDSFKGSLSTFESGDAVSNGIKNVFPSAETVVCPLADGGEGTVAAIVSALEGRLVSVPVMGPLGNVIMAEYGILPEKRTAVIEMSAAAGITLIEKGRRDPLKTTTYGVGELISHAIKVEGCREFIIGIGGSATNDGGVGMLMALGYEFLDINGDHISFGAKGLEALSAIKTENALGELRDCHFHIACDVNNPLCGENGASAVYGPQKGATPQNVKDMDAWLSHYAHLTGRTLGNEYSAYPGAGAAGGLGFAFLSYLGGELTSGIELVMSATGLEEHIKDADIVVTGEGRLDGQSCMGKAPVGVARLAKKYGKRVIAFAGCVTDDAVECNAHGIDAFFPILRAPCSLEDAMDIENARENLTRTAVQTFSLIKSYI